MSASASSPLSPEEKISLLLETLESIRASLDETISYIDDSMIEADERG